MISGLAVLEISGSVAGGYAAKLLADRGALVTVVTPPHREPSRLDTGVALYLNADKTEVQNVTEEQLENLGNSADIVIESSAPDPLVSVLDRFAPNDRRIEIRLSPFGLSGPWRAYRSTDLTDQAIAGHLYLNGDPDREPLQGPQHQVAYAAGVHGAIGALAAVHARTTTGRGQRVEVTHHEVMTALHQFTLLRYTHNGDVLRRMGNRYAGPGRPVGLYPCGDGLISLIAPRGDQVETLLSIAGLDHLLERPDVNNVYDVMHHPTLLDEHLTPWLAAQDLEETIELLQAVRVPAASVSNMADLLADEHLSARDYWRPIDHDGETVQAPRSPILTTVAKAADQAGTDGRVSNIDGTGEAGSPDVPAVDPSQSLADGPLSGIRVLDLTRVWAGPCATRIMADLGADVIMIEAPWARGGATVDEISVMATRFYPDNDPGDEHWNRNGFSNKFNINKRNVSLDLSKPGGTDVLADLVKSADVLIENYSPRVMPQFGLDEHRLHELNPSLIYVTMPGFGRTGPMQNRVAYGPIVDSQGGLSVLMGYEGESARKAGVAWPDPAAGIHAAFAAVAAVVDRAADGQGRTVELAQLEVTVAMAGHAVIDRQLTGVEPTPTGNRHRRLAPQGVYRCAGDDRWLAISVIDQESWTGLCNAAGFESDWFRWTEAERRSATELIDQRLTAWTSTAAPEDLMVRLQAASVPAAAVQDAARVMADPHHADRAFFVDITHPVAGTHSWPRVPIRLTETPASYRTPGANLNQHGAEVLRQVAGYDEAKINELRARSILADRPPD